MKLTKKQEFLCKKLKLEKPEEKIIEYIKKFNKDFKIDEDAVKKYLMKKC